jgi:hypothetical protein
MVIELAAGEQRQFDMALTPVPVAAQLAITELFICTRMDTDHVSADDRIYVGVSNLGASAVTGELNIWDWQAWWEHVPGDERLWRNPTFTILAGGIFRYAATVHHLSPDETYFRVDVRVNNAVVLETPRLYIEPGKQYTGRENIAVGACTYKAPGLAVVWYSQRSNCNTWDGNIHTPEFPPFQHDVHWGTYRTGNYGTTVWWPAVFVPIIDPKIIAGATYYAYISGGGAGGAWRECWFNFVAV